MATQFASVNNSKNYSGRLTYIGSFDILSQDAVANTTTLRLYGSVRNNNTPYSYSSDYSTFKIAGSTIYSGSYTFSSSSTSLGYTDRTVTHNADGTFPSTSYTITADSYHFDNSATGSITGVPSLDRVAPTVTISLASRTSNSLTINATASATCDYWEFSRDNGSTWIANSSTEGTAVSYTFTGLSPNTTYNIKVRARKKVNQIKGTSSTGAYTTIGQALLNSVQGFYADASTVIVKPNITVYSSSFTYELAIKKSSTTVLTLSIAAQSTGTKDVSVTLSSAQRTTLLSAMSSVASFSATFELKTLNNGTQVGSVSTATATISTSSSTSAPTQASFSYADVNATTVAVTGDSTKLVQGQSTLRLTNLTATAKNGASVASYNITIGGVTKSVTSGGTVEMGVISQSGTLSLSVVVTDTRGYTSTKTVSVTSYAYAPPTISAYSVKRNDATSTQIDMSFSGTFSNVGNNTVTANYKYKQTTAGSYNSPTSVTVTKSGGSFSYSGSNIATFDDEYVYDFVITLADSIVTETYYITVPSYEPLIAFRPNAVGFGTVPQQQYNLETSQSWGAHFRGQYNHFEYMPYSFDTEGVSGTDGYVRIATLTLKPTVSTYASMPIRFDIARRYDSRVISLYLRLAHENNTDPAIESLYFEGGYGGLYNTAFSAFAYRVGVGIYDVYVAKSGTWGYIDVWTYIPPFMAYRCNVSYSSNLLSSVPNNAVMAEEYAIVNTRKYNVFRYSPYSFVTNGGSNTAGYARIASVQITGTWNYTPNTFTVQRLTDKRPITLSLFFRSEGNTTPLDIGLYYDGLEGVSASYPFEAYVIYNSSLVTLDVYVKKVSASDVITVTSHISNYTQGRTNITYSHALATSVPSGAVMATIVPCLNPTAPTFTKTSGNSYISGAKVYQSGNTVQVYLVINVTGTIGITDNIWVGTYGGFPLPVDSIPNSTMNGNSIIVGYWSSTGSLTFRNFGANLSSGATIGFGITYLTNG